MSEARSSKNSDFAAEKALVDKAAIAPLPNSEKIYVTRLARRYSSSYA